MSTLKEKLRRCEYVKGMHIAVTDPQITELCASLGYDFLWIDTEHTPIGYETLITHLMAAKAGGTASIVRVPWNDPIMAKRVLEQGPDGIIFPVVNNAEELDKAMKSTLYPPDGNRGFGPQRAMVYGASDVNEYIKKGSLDLIRCVQIESWQAVDALPEMVKNPWIDCFIYGPCDLSGTMNMLNDVFNPKVQAVLKKGVEICKKAGKSIGVSTGSDDPAVLKLWRDLGLNFISAGTDYLHVCAGAKKVLETLKSFD